jgi:hypothetical protein
MNAILRHVAAYAAFAGLTGLTAAAAPEDDWTQLSALLANIQGVATTPPAGIVTDKFTTGALLGNGDIGAVAGDTVTTQKFYFSKGDFLGGFHNIAKRRYENSYLAIGALLIASPAGKGRESADAAAAYRMEQDILNAEVRTTLKIDGTVVSLRSWIAADDNVFITEFSTAPGAPAVAIEAALQETPNESFPHSTGVANGLPWVTREVDNRAEVKSRVALAMTLVSGAFTRTAADGVASRGVFTVPSGKTVTLAVIVASDTKFGSGCAPIEAICARAVSAARAVSEANVAGWQSAHRDWWKAYWLKSYVRVHDPVLERYYYGSLYVLGSAARPGKTLPSMWGPWLTTDTPAWGGRHFFNYNAQGPYYGIASSNRPELLLPYSEFVLAELPYQVNLTHAAGYQGATWKRSYAPLDLFSPRPAKEPVAPHRDYHKLQTDQKSNGGFAATLMIEYYDYTKDKTYLREKLYPVLRELDAFWRDFMEKEPVPGGGFRYVIRHTGAHEVPIAEDVNPNLDLGYFRMVDRALIDASHELGVDDEMIPVWQDVLAHLSAYPTGTYDGKECYQECEVRAVGVTDPDRLMHRTDQPINMEGAVHPGENVTLGGDPHWIQVGLNTYGYMDAWGLSGRKMNNAFCKVWPQAVRLGWPADDFMAKFKACIGTLWRESNLTCFQGGGGLETCGSIDAINCMLLQSNFEELRLFPVWPKTREAEFKRLRAKGAFVVSSTFAHGQVGPIEIVSEKGRPVKIINPWPSDMIDVAEVDGPAKQPVAFTVKDRAITFSTAAGKTYVVRPKA